MTTPYRTVADPGNSLQVDEEARAITALGQVIALIKDLTPEHQAKVINTVNTWYQDILREYDDSDDEEEDESAD